MDIPHRLRATRSRSPAVWKLHDADTGEWFATVKTEEGARAIVDALNKKSGTPRLSLSEAPAQNPTIPTLTDGL
jgi:hypothetical protein